MSQNQTEGRLVELGALVAASQDEPLPFPESERRDAFLAATEPRTRDRRRPFVWLGFLAVCSFALALGVWRWQEPKPEQILVGTRRTPQHAGAWLAASGSPVPMFFPDGSSAELGSTARLRLVTATPRASTLTLEQGQLRAWLGQVSNPELAQSDKLWRVNVGPFTLSCSRAQFLVSWDPNGQRLQVSVSAGEVDVVGPILGETKAIQTGHSLRVVVPELLAVLTTMVEAESPRPASSVHDSRNSVPLQ